MTTGIEFLKPVPAKRGRGPGKKPALCNTSIRLPREVMLWYREQYPYTMQSKMRELLTAHMMEHVNG